MYWSNWFIWAGVVWGSWYHVIAVVHSPLLHFSEDVDMPRCVCVAIAIIISAGCLALAQPTVTVGPKSGPPTEKVAARGTRHQAKRVHSAHHD
jgi:hypothetical protein